MVKKVMERKLMIHSLSENIADFLLSKDCFEKENLDIYVYGTELILSTALGIIIVSILSIVFNCIAQGLLFYLTFYTIRKYSGGLHCNTHLKCNLTYLSVFILSVLIDSVVKNSVYRIFILITFVVFSLITIILFAPIENINKPIKYEDRKKFKIISIIIYLSHILLFVLLNYFFEIKADIIIITDLFVAFLIIVTLFLKNERRNKNENS